MSARALDLIRLGGEAIRKISMLFSVSAVEPCDNSKVEQKAQSFVLLGLLLHELLHVHAFLYFCFVCLRSHSSRLVC